MTHAKFLTAALAAASAALIAVSAGQSIAGDDRSARDEGSATKAPRCVSTPLDQTVVIDRKTLLITDYRGNAVILKMAGECLTPHEAVGLEFYGGGGQICRPLDVTVTGDITSVVPMRCMVSKVEPISREAARELQSQR